MPMALAIEAVQLHVHEAKRLMGMHNSLFYDLHD
jgi:hypothetical protein